MRGFFVTLRMTAVLGMAASGWMRGVCAMRRMTALLGVAAVLGVAALLGMTAPAVMDGWTGSADKVALFQLGSVSIGPRLQRRRLALIAAMMSDRKSTRLNSSHLGISYAVFC